jgi:hypothetical protein
LDGFGEVFTSAATFFGADLAGDGGAEGCGCVASFGGCLVERECFFGVGLGMSTAGATQAKMGFSGVAMTLSMASSSAFLLWVALASILMSRWASRPDGDGDVA